MKNLNIKLALTALAMASATTAFAMQDKSMMKNDMMKKDMMEESKMMKNEIMTYSDKAFNMALKNGDMIVIDFYKDGCPVCAKQHPTIEKATSIYPNAKFFKVNFKKDVSTVNKFKVGSQSTIVVFNNGEEINRTVGQTKEASLLQQFASAAK
tara:strand:- start:3690 stop:4148 length:459 start_codon:yes stop_codon:yes gene_type:complete